MECLNCGHITKRPKKEQKKKKGMRGIRGNKVHQRKKSMLGLSCKTLAQH
jgi:hypothetical protein